MRVFRYKTLNSGYKKLCKTILTNPCDFEKISFKGSGKGKYVNKKSRWHLRNVHVMIENPAEFTEWNVACPERSKVMNDYMQRETVLFDDGVIDSNKMGEISKVWKLIENPDETINANYGYMVYHLRDAGNPKFDDAMMTQWEWCKDRLMRNPGTLQAYMHFNRPKDQWIHNLDQPCTVYVQMTIVDGKLNIISNMRSNDIIFGTPYNMSYFAKMQKKMVKELSDASINVQPGSLFHNVASLHLYEDRLDICESIVGEKQ